MAEEPTFLRGVVNQWVIPGISAVLGGWMGVEVTMAKLDSEFRALEGRINRSEINFMMQDQLSTAERREFRERIARLEARQEQVMLRLRMETSK